LKQKALDRILWRIRFRSD